MNNITFDDIYHQTNFIDSLQYIPNALVGNEIPIAPIPAGFYQVNGLTALPNSTLPYLMYLDSVNISPRDRADSFNYFLSFYTIPQTAGPVTPSRSFTNFDDFKAAWQAFTGGSVGNAAGLFRGLLLDFATSQSIEINGSNDIVVGSSDWDLFLTPPPVPNMAFSAQTAALNPFIRTFNAFLSQFKYPPSNLSGDLGFYNYFLTQWHLFLSNIAVLKNSSAVGVFANLATYEAIYKVYARDSSDAAFQARLKQFYMDKTTTTGYFLPSHFFGDWITAIRNENGSNVNLGSIGSSLEGNSSEKVLVLNRIIRLLISIIQTLQNVGIAQANRLTFITKYQNVYTTLQTQIPVFLKDGRAPIGVAGTEPAQTRNDLNSSFNGILTDNLRSLRGIQEDNAKKLQSNVNQTNDAVNQQTDMASTFIQQLSTLLSTIMR